MCSSDLADPTPEAITGSPEYKQIESAMLRVNPNDKDGAKAFAYKFARNALISQSTSEAVPEPTAQDMYNEQIEQQAKELQFQSLLQQEAAKAELKAKERELDLDNRRRLAYDVKRRINANRMDALRQDILSNKIDPRRFWTSRSNGQKAMILAGLALSQGSSMSIIQSAIQRDLESQREELGKKENLLDRKSTRLNSSH